MPNVTITNIQSVDDFLPSLYKTFTPGEAITIFRDQSTLDGMQDLKDRVAAGQFTATTVYTVQELLSNIMKLSCAPGSVVSPGQKIQRGESPPIPVDVPSPPLPIAFPEAFKAATDAEIAITADGTLAAGAQYQVEILNETNAGFDILVTLLVPGPPGSTIQVEWVAVGEAA